mmetsp:Transcript_1760/g.3916  ORF Transcript_1760/g.3916 Transcript_1760/m.3916 type:complete len:470 (-) Transcript_1760:59-1468(-)
MPIDINTLRKDKGGDPDLVRKSEERRFRDPKVVDTIIECDEAWIKGQFQLEMARKEVNKVQTQIKDRKKASKGSDACEDLLGEKEEKEKAVVAQEEAVAELLAKRDAALHKIGNIVHDSVPVSKDEEKDNEVVSLWGNPTIFPEGSYGQDGSRPHYQILYMLGAVEFAIGHDVAGHRGYFLTGPGVILNQALLNYGLAFTARHGFKAVQPPFFMKKDLMGLAAELKDYDEVLYKIVESADHPELDKYLIATSEQPLTCFHMNQTLEPKNLPHKYCGISSCFRKEAGSSGRDIRGIFRVHQFEKIEQFVVTHPDDSWAEHQRMINMAEEFYQSLDIPYRVVNIVSGELNDAAAKKFDLEAWFPGDNEGKGQYRELVSCSNTTDYPARAVQTKYGFVQKSEKNPQQQYCHMLNSTLCATERAMCCLVENYQTKTGLRVPRVLVPFCGGVEFFPFVRAPMKEEADKKAGKKK